MTTDKGTLFVFSGPSGTGKGTILELFNQTYGSYGIKYSVSATSRPPRPGEVDGTNYYFMSQDDFIYDIKNDGFLEWASFCDNYYGTPKKPVMDSILKGEDVILEIETNGAMQVKEKYPEAVLIFVLPPSLSELRRRLTDRGTETPEVVEKRLAAALNEIKLVNKYDYIIVNDQIVQATNDLKSIVDAQRLKTNINKNKINEVLEK